MGLAAAEVEAAVRREQLVAILRLRDHGNVVQVAETLVEHGVTVLEITLDHPDSVASVRKVADALGDSAVLGAGTVLEPEQVTAARDAGARFCVSPHTDPQLITAVLAAGLAPVPGVLTPTELVTASRAGAILLKVFPSGAQGTGHMRALLGPFADAALIPTGGIGIDDIPTWLGAGATAVALGSALVDRDGTVEGLADRARRAVAAVAAARKDAR